MDKQEKKFRSSSEFPRELCVEGTFLEWGKERREWTDKQSGQPRELEVDCILVRTKIGTCVVRCFNPSYDFSTFKDGDSICIPVEEYKKENGLKAFVARV